MAVPSARERLVDERGRRDVVPQPAARHSAQHETALCAVSSHLALLLKSLTPRTHIATVHRMYGHSEAGRAGARGAATKRVWEARTSDAISFSTMSDSSGRVSAGPNDEFTMSYRQARQ